jgi:hypothetical protein
MAGVGFVVCGLLVAGCDSANSAAKKAEEGVKKAASGAQDVAKEAAGKVKEVAQEVKEDGKEAAAAAQLAFLKPLEEALPKIEEKIKGLSGDSAVKAKEKLEEFKKLLGQCKSAAPEKWQSLKDGLLKSFDELKKLAGVDK